MRHTHAHATGPRALPWLESFGVGHDTIDEEHQALLAACNDLCALAQTEPDGAALRRAAQMLVATVEQHFAHEEALFPAIGYDRQLSHMREHLSVVDGLHRLLLKGAGMDMAVAANTARLLLLEHILRHDLQFKTWVLHAKGR